MSLPPRVGVLALQGDWAAHVEALGAAAARSGRVVEISATRCPADLTGLDGLVIPGGESTTLLKLLAMEGLDAAIGRWVREGEGCVFGTCAGAILLSRHVRSPEQGSLGLLDAVIERNSYGRQVDSFIESLPTGAGSELGAAPLEAVFIRAPRFLEVGKGVEILLARGDEPVLVRQGRVLAATFHPEMTKDTRVHGLFLQMLDPERETDRLSG